MTTTNKGIIFRKCGGPEVLNVEEVPSVEPKNGEVQIKVHSVGLNRAEALYRMGYYVEYPKFPSSLGIEASGTVVKVGEGENNFKVGDEVSVLPASRTHTNNLYITLPSYCLVKNPTGVTHDEMASIWLAYLTGYYALFDIGKIKKDDFVVITAASSSAGLAAIQLAKSAGAKVIATSRTSVKKPVIMEYGADYFIATTEEPGLEKSILSITNNQGADIVYDCIAGPTLTQLANVTRFKGTIVVYGSLSTEPTIYPMKPILGKYLTLKGYLVSEYTSEPASLKRGVEYILKHLGGFKSLIGKKFNGLENIQEAHKFLDSKDLFGKVIVEF
eukprot:gene1468-1851_t